MNKHSIILPPPEKAPIHSGNIISWMWYFLLPYKWTVIGFFSWRTIRYTIDASVPLVIGFVIDGLENGKAFDNPAIYAYVLLGYGILFVISLVNIVFTPEVRVFEKAARGMTLYSINHLNRLSLNWHEKQGSGGKLQRVMTGRKGFQEFSRHVRWDVFPLIGNIFAICVTGFIADMPTFYLGLFFCFVASYLFSSWYFARPYLGLYDKFNQKFEKLLSGVYEFVSAVRTVKAFHLGGYIQNKAQRLEEEGQEAIIKAYHTNLLRWTICNLLGSFWIFIFIGGGFYLAFNQTISIGVYTATVFFAINLWWSCEILGSILEKFYEYGNGVYRLIETLRVRPKNLDLEPSKKIPHSWETINLRNLTYVYEGDAGQGIKDISFTVKRGEKIAFVGNSGAGKSTLVKILMKQMLPNNGDLKIDNTNVSNIPTADWLSQIGFVPQDVELFNLSIRDNILVDRDDIDETFLRNVLEQSALDEFIDSLPSGLDTVIGERGIKLSGGQRQRLGIARALVRSAPIMIFDEATSSLDSISESKIQTAIENSFSGRTVFVIAHRLSTIRNVDTIIVLDNGQIIEEGSFDGLLAKDGHFAKLWAIQSKTENKSAEIL